MEKAGVGPNRARIPILYRDDDYVVVSKPAGLLVHRTALASQETMFAMQLVRDLLGQRVFPVHRLDRPTSGALVFGLSSEAAHMLSLEFRARRVDKQYLAVVRGWAPVERVIDYDLREELDARADGADGFRTASSAVTVVRRIADVELPFAVDRYPSSRYSLVGCRPVTGRKHQIRRHLRHIGHPIIGDITHGVGKHNRFFESQFGIRRLLLACTMIGFSHPRTGEPLIVRAPLCPEFARVVRELGWCAFIDGQAAHGNG
jgi:tRNA pseudouridine65 synthase